MTKTTKQKFREIFLSYLTIIVLVLICLYPVFSFLGHSAIFLPKKLIIKAVLFTVFLPTGAAIFFSRDQTGIYKRMSLELTKCHEEIKILNLTYDLLDISILDSLRHMLSSGNRSASDKIIKNLFKDLGSKDMDDAGLKQIYYSFRSVYSSVSDKFEINIQTSLPDLGLSECRLCDMEEIFLKWNSLICRYYEDNISQSAQTKGYNVLAYIDENFRDPNLCASSIADHFGLSEKYIFQLVKNAGEETLNDRISSLRVEEAVNLLETTKMSVQDIALSSGFTSSNSMYKVFMRVKGVSPSSYRKKEH